MREINDAFRLIRHAPLRYQFTPTPQHDPRSSERQFDTKHEQRSYINDRLEYMVRIAAGGLFGAFVAFMMILSDVPLPVGIIIPLVTMVASVRFGDAFWRWALRYWWLWVP